MASSDTTEVVELPQIVCSTKVGGRRVKLREYRIWGCMKARCYNKNSTKYHNYGGRGITICDEWRESFAAFMRDMGNAPSSKHSIDRIENSLGYFKGNCRWATDAEQRRNRRNNRPITVNGETLLMIEWAEKTGIPDTIIGYRLKVGWSPEQAVTLPVKRGQIVHPKKRSRGSSKLTEADVLDIRQLRRDGAKNRDIARRYGICESAASHIALGRNWGDVQG